LPADLLKLSNEFDIDRGKEYNMDNEKNNLNELETAIKNFIDSEVINLRKIFLYPLSPLYENSQFIFDKEELPLEKLSQIEQKLFYLYSILNNDFLRRSNLENYLNDSLSQLKSHLKSFCNYHIEKYIEEIGPELRYNINVLSDEDFSWLMNNIEKRVKDIYEKFLPIIDDISKFYQKKNNLVEKVEKGEKYAATLISVAQWLAPIFGVPIPIKIDDLLKPVGSKVGGKIGQKLAEPELKEAYKYLRYNLIVAVNTYTNVVDEVCQILNSSVSDLKTLIENKIYYINELVNERESIQKISEIEKRLDDILSREYKYRIQIEQFSNKMRFVNMVALILSLVSILGFLYLLFKIK
jgi:hypothetical protein